jgi:hypothetical protein
MGSRPPRQLQRIDPQAACRRKLQSEKWELREPRLDSFGPVQGGPAPGLTRALQTDAFDGQGVSVGVNSRLIYPRPGGCQQEISSERSGPDSLIVSNPNKISTRPKPVYAFRRARLDNRSNRRGKKHCHPRPGTAAAIGTPCAPIDAATPALFAVTVSSPAGR